MERLSAGVAAVMLAATPAQASCLPPELPDAFIGVETLADMARAYLATDEDDNPQAFVVIGTFRRQDAHDQTTDAPLAHALIAPEDWVGLAHMQRPHDRDVATRVSFDYVNAFAFEGVRIDGDRMHPFATDRTIYTALFDEAHIPLPPPTGTPVFWVVTGPGPEFWIENDFLCGSFRPALGPADGRGDLAPFLRAAEACLETGACDISTRPYSIDIPARDALGSGD